MRRKISIFFCTSHLDRFRGFAFRGFMRAPTYLGVVASVETLSFSQSCCLTVSDSLPYTTELGPHGSLSVL